MNRNNIDKNHCENPFVGYEDLFEEAMTDSNRYRNKVRFKRGETLVKQGTMVNHVMFVQSGYVKLEFESDTGLVLLDVISEGRMICLSGLFGDDIAKYSVIALTETQICDISRGFIEQMVIKHGDFAARIVKNLNGQNDYLFERISSLNQKQMHGRVADVLLYLADSVFKSDVIPSILSRRDLGNYSGMAMMSVIRTIQAIKSDGIIDEHDGKLYIIDKNRLIQLSRNA
jgi:CRP-like cAMP-binding protein